MENKTYGPGEVIFREGTYADTMYEIGSGSVGIFSAYGMPEEERLAVLGAGESFGEMGLAECYPRSATAVALEETVATELGAQDFGEYFSDNPSKVLAIMRQMSGRLRETNERYVQACATVYEAIEAEKAQQRRDSSLVNRLASMVRSLGRSKANED